MHKYLIEQREIQQYGSRKETGFDSEKYQKCKYGKYPAEYHTE